MGVLKVKVGADWLPVAQGFDATPAGYIGIGLQTAAQSGINAETDVTGCTVTWNADPTHTYKTTAFTVLRQSAANGEQYAQITDAANSAKKGWAQTCVSGAVNTVQISVVESGLSGSITRKLRINTVGGTVATQAQGTQYISYILVEDITTVVPMSAAVATAWQAPALVNGWVDYAGGYQPIQYRRINDMVYIRGLGKSGTANTMFTLPVGYRPLYSVQFAVDNAGAYGMAEINPAGAVLRVVGGNTAFNLNGIAFAIN